MVVTSTDELQQAGDAFMSGVGEGAADAGGQVLDGSVFANDQGIAYYEASYISNIADASFALLPYDGTMTIVCIYDAGSADDFAFANDVLLSIADTAVLAGAPDASGAGDAGADAGDAADLGSLAAELGGETQLV